MTARGKSVTEMQTKEWLATLERMMRMFLPYAFRVRAQVRKNKGRFVHYTSAKTALKIINTTTMWLRNTTCMADYRARCAQGLWADAPCRHRNLRVGFDRRDPLFGGPDATGRHRGLERGEVGRTRHPRLDDWR